jgi:ATP-dependent exoDNAse (exonuclease V) alpha subunit
MTRGRRFVVLVGQRKALAIAVRNDRAAERFSGLYDRLVTSQIDPSGRSHHNCYNTGT